MADMVVISPVLDTISMFITNACDVIDDVSLACVIVLRSVSDDISIFITDCSGVYDGASLVNIYNTYFAPCDICFDDTARARVSCSIWAAATDFRRFMPGSIRIHYTEMLSISQRRSDSP